MAQGPYSTHSWRPVPISARRARFGDVPASSTDPDDDDGDDGAGAGAGAGRVGWLRSALRVVGRFLWVICTGLGLLVAIVLAAVAVGYAVDNHSLIEKLGGGGVGTIVDTAGCAVAPFAPTKDFSTPPARVVLRPPPRKWRPFYSQWTCGQTSLSLLPNLLANGHNSFADENNYTDYFIRYTDIVRYYGGGGGRLTSCARAPTQNPVGGGGAVTCTPAMTWGRKCGPQETAAGTANVASTLPVGSVTPASSTVPTPCGSEWHAPSTQEQMALDGHAYCARFCDGFPGTRFFNVRRDGKRIGCYCLSQCLGNDNPTVSTINKVAGSNEWDVWALDEKGFTPELLAAPAL
jgi:hypothetical protein